MAGPSGFTNRYKGRQAFPVGGIVIGGTSLTGSGADLNVNTGWGSVETVTSTANTGAIKNSGLSLLLSTALAIYALAAPVAGVQKIIEVQAGSSGVMIKTSTVLGVTIQGGSTTLGASTLTNVMKSTATLVATQIELVGQSSLAYLFMGVYPSTLSHLLFSTTT